MSNKKQLKPADLDDSYQALLEQYYESNQTPKEFISTCLREGAVTASDASSLLNRLSSDFTKRSYALADVSDERFFRFGLYETTKEDCENSPVFMIQCADELREYEEDVLKLLETFSRDLAHLVVEKETKNEDMLVNPVQPYRDATSDKEQLAMLEAWEPNMLMN